MAQQFPMSPQANPAAFTTLIPVAPRGAILAEQMKAMALSGKIELHAHNKIPAVFGSP